MVNRVIGAVIIALNIQEHEHPLFFTLAICCILIIAEQDVTMKIEE